MDPFTPAPRWFSSSRLAIMLLAIAIVAISRRTSADDASRVPRVRAMDRDLARLVVDGARVSPLFRALLERLGRSKVIVHVESRLLPSSVWARTMLVATQAGWRYVRIQIDYCLGVLDRLVMIGHELQHAVELALSEAVDRRSVEAFYQRIGFRTDLDGQAFETVAARDTGNTIRREFASRVSGPEGKGDLWSARAHR